MPVYESETLSRDELEKLRKKSSCKVCGGWVNMFFDIETGKAFIACKDWLRSHHDGIMREGRLFEENIPARRERMEKEYGQEKALALADAANVAVMTKSVAVEIIETLWGDAPTIEKTKAIMMCYQYNLNPLMKHLHMVGYRRRDKEGKFIKDAKGKDILDWSIMIGIQATRLMSHRKHKFTYLDMTPRKATDEEVNKILGDTAREDIVYGFTHIKDLETGAEAFGLKGWPTKDKVKGEEKGNTQLNMACVRSERQAIDRLYPSELPVAEVMDERFVELENGRQVDTETGEIKKAEAEKPEEPEDKLEPEKESPAEPEPERKATKEEIEELEKVFLPEERQPQLSSEPTPPKSFIDVDWLKESLETLEAKDPKTWGDKNLLSYMKLTYKIDGDSPIEVASRLNKNAAAHFCKIIQQAL